MKKNEGTHGALLLMVGGYIAFMGYKMYQNTVAGLSTMSMTTTVVAMSLMILAGLAVMVYGGVTFYHGWQEQKKGIPEDNEEIIEEEDDE